MEWEKSGRSVMDMECECFCESKSELPECGDRGGWGRIQVTVELE